MPTINNMKPKIKKNSVMQVDETPATPTGLVGFSIEILFLSKITSFIFRCRYFIITNWWSLIFIVYQRQFLFFRTASFPIYQYYQGIQDNNVLWFACPWEWCRDAEWISSHIQEYQWWRKVSWMFQGADRDKREKYKENTEMGCQAPVLLWID